MANVQDGKQKVKASDVIWPARERDVKDDPSLEAITHKIRVLANSCGQLGLPLVARELEEIARYLAKRHDHADPCDDTACPCRKAEADDWRDQGLARP